MNVNYEIFTMLYGMKFRRFMEKMLKSIEEEYELNKVDLQIMFYLYSAGDKNSSKDIMELEMFTRGHISQSLGRLAEKGVRAHRTGSGGQKVHPQQSDGESRRGDWKASESV